MLISILSMLGGLVLLAIGAEALVRGSSALALRMGITPLTVGLTVVAIGTGSPELVVSVESAMGGNSAIALGNVVGSNICNIALILGLAALVRPMKVRSELIRREVPVMIGVTLVLWFLMSDGMLDRQDGFLLTIWAVVYLAFACIFSRLSGRDAVAEEFEHELPSRRTSKWLAIGLVVIGLCLLVGGARLLVAGAIFVATIFGVSQVVIGLTVVAIGTSLPELATSTLAAWKDDADVAFGNAIGSNILNILLILGITAVIRPIETTGLKQLDMLVLIGTSMLLLALMRRGMMLNRWEGALLVGGYGAYLFATAS